MAARDLEFRLEEEEPLDVHDLPQIYTKPSARTLLDTLSLLSLEPRSWDATPSSTPGGTTPRTTSGTNTPSLQPKRKVRSEGIPHYLTRIVSSPLEWIGTDEEKEEIWDAASIRLSERSGRTGMGAISRKFRIPMRAESLQEDDYTKSDRSPPNMEDDTIEIELHEPALTEDNLGLKTWASSYVLAKKWHQLRTELALAVTSVSGTDGAPFAMLELGAGTGLVGLSAAAVLGLNVLLTDLPEIVPNLARNAGDNAELLSSCGGSATAAVIDWTKPQEVRFAQEMNNGRCSEEIGGESVVAQTQRPGTRGLSVPVIVAADPIYSSDHPKLLSQAVECHMKRSPEARLIVEMPIRETYAAERADFVSCMQGVGLSLIREEKGIGYDDWSEGRGEDLAEVECWMTMWAWKTT
ncbi:hypothetical protein MBLNU457_2089t1 [Dothideomycetes sp. NU457]